MLTYLLVCYYTALNMFFSVTGFCMVLPIVNSLASFMDTWAKMDTFACM